MRKLEKHIRLKKTKHFCWRWWSKNGSSVVVRITTVEEITSRKGGGVTEELLDLVEEEIEIVHSKNGCCG